MKVLNAELVMKSASSLCFTEDGEVLEVALKKLNNIDEELLEKVRSAEINLTTPVASQKLIMELRNIIGGKAVEGIIERSMKKLFIKH